MERENRSAKQINSTLIEAVNIRKYFLTRRSGILKHANTWIRAVDGISFKIDDGETFSLVGESGCGKTTTAMLILLLERLTSGAIYFRGKNIHELEGKDLRDYRGAVQAVFQDPWGSLNPKMRVGLIIQEPLKLNRKLSKVELQDRMAEVLLQVGLHPWQSSLFPHEFSGGQRQRIAIARALSMNPSLIILDEPISSLDVSMQAQVMNLLRDLQEKYRMSYLFIAHNLATVQYLSHRVGVMYLGEMIEESPSEEIFQTPLHPYTKALISVASPVRLDEMNKEMVLEGEIPSPANPPSGCRFHTRCPFAVSRCKEQPPNFRELSPRHWVSCHLY